MRRGTWDVGLMTLELGTLNLELGTLNLELGTPFHIFPDQDAAGEQLYNRLVEASIHHGFTLVKHQLPAGCKDFSDFYLLNVKC